MLMLNYLILLMFNFYVYRILLKTATSLGNLFYQIIKLWLIYWDTQKYEFYKNLKFLWNYYWPNFIFIIKISIYLVGTYWELFVVKEFLIWCLTNGVSICPEIGDFVPYLTIENINLCWTKLNSTLYTNYELVKDLIKTSYYLIKTEFINLCKGVILLFNFIINRIYTNIQISYVVFTKTWTFFFKPFILECWETRGTDNFYLVLNKWLKIDNCQYVVLNKINSFMLTVKQEDETMIFLITSTFICIGWHDSNINQLIWLKFKQFVLTCFLFLLNCWIILHIKPELSWLLVIEVISASIYIRLRRLKFFFKITKTPVPLVSVFCLFFWLLLTTNTTLAIIINCTSLKYLITRDLFFTDFSQLPYLYYIGYFGYSWKIIKFILIIIYVNLFWFHYQNKIASYYNVVFILVQIDKIFTSTKRKKPNSLLLLE